MRNMRAYVACLLCLALWLCPWAGRAEAPGYSGVITLSVCLEPAGSGASLEGAALRCFEARLAEWRDAHPEIELIESVRMEDELAALALMERLPDVFLASAGAGRVLAKYSCVRDLTDAVLGSEYAARYDNVQLMPFVTGLGLAAFPALSRARALVIYDAGAWADGFPDRWDALLTSAGELEARGCRGAVAFGYADGVSAVGCVLSGMLTGGDAGWDWLERMVRTEASRGFREDGVVDALDRASAMLTSGVFLRGGADMSAGDAVGSFVKGECPALLVRGEDVCRALDRVAAEAPELYARLDFAALPTPGAAGESPAPEAMPYGLFIREGLDDAPEKLAACLELCRELTGPAYADALASEYGLTGFTAASDAAWAAFGENAHDETRLRLSRFLRETTATCPDATRFLRGEVWTACGDGLLRAVRASDVDRASDADRGTTYVPTAEQIANDMQDAYERYYLVGENN